MHKSLKINNLAPRAKPELLQELLFFAIFVSIFETEYMDNNQPKPQNQLSIELNPQTTKVSYSNLAIISHSRSEFVLDFATTLPGLPKAMVSDRIIMTPEHAKRLMNALFDNVSKYEAQFGVIDLGGSKGPQGQGGGTFNLADFGPFGGGKN